MGHSGIWQEEILISASFSSLVPLSLACSSRLGATIWVPDPVRTVRSRPDLGSFGGFWRSDTRKNSLKQREPQPMDHNTSRTGPIKQLGSIGKMCQTYPGGGLQKLRAIDKFP